MTSLSWIQVFLSTKCKQIFATIAVHRVLLGKQLTHQLRCREYQSIGNKGYISENTSKTQAKDDKLVLISN